MSKKAVFLGLLWVLHSRRCLPHPDQRSRNFKSAENSDLPLEPVGDYSSLMNDIRQMQQSSGAKLVPVSARASDGLILRRVDVAANFDDAPTRAVSAIRAFHRRGGTRAHRRYGRVPGHDKYVHPLTRSSSGRHCCNFVRSSVKAGSVSECRLGTLRAAA